MASHHEIIICPTSGGHWGFQLIGKRLYYNPINRQTELIWQTRTMPGSIVFIWISVVKIDRNIKFPSNCTIQINIKCLGSLKIVGTNPSVDAIQISIHKSVFIVSEFKVGWLSHSIEQFETNIFMNYYLIIFEICYSWFQCPRISSNFIIL